MKVAKLNMQVRNRSRPFATQTYLLQTTHSNLSTSCLSRIKCDTVVLPHSFKVQGLVLTFGGVNVEFTFFSMGLGGVPSIALVSSLIPNICWSLGYLAAINEHSNKWLVRELGEGQH